MNDGLIKGETLREAVCRGSGGFQCLCWGYVKGSSILKRIRQLMPLSHRVL